MDIDAIIENRKRNEEILAHTASSLWAYEIGVPHNYNLGNLFELNGGLEINLDIARNILKNIYLETPFIIVENSGFKDEKVVDLSSFRITSGVRNRIFNNSRDVVSDAVTLVDIQSYFDCPSVVVLGVDVESDKNTTEHSKLNSITKYFQLKNTNEFPLKIERKMIYIDGVYYSCVVFTGTDRFETKGSNKKIIVPIVSFGDRIEEYQGIYRTQV